MEPRPAVASSDQTRCSLLVIRSFSTVAPFAGSISAIVPSALTTQVVSPSR
jgi:hypothetical protein